MAACVPPPRCRRGRRGGNGRDAARGAGREGVGWPHERRAVGRAHQIRRLGAEGQMFGFLTVARGTARKPTNLGCYHLLYVVQYVPPRFWLGFWSFFSAVPCTYVCTMILHGEGVFWWVGDRRRVFEKGALSEEAPHSLESRPLMSWLVRLVFTQTAARY